MTLVPDNPEQLLTRRATAAALTALGYPTTPKGLAMTACRGVGPPFQKFGSRTVLYQWGSVLAWAKSRLGPEQRSTTKVHPRSGLGAP